MVQSADEVRSSNTGEWTHKHFAHLSQFSGAFLKIFSLLKPGYCRALAQPPLLWVCLPTSCSLDDLPKRGPARGAGGGGAHTGDAPHRRRP